MILIYRFIFLPTNFFHQVCATVGTQHWIYNVTQSAPLTLYQSWTYPDTAYGEQLGKMKKILPVLLCAACFCS